MMIRPKKIREIETNADLQINSTFVRCAECGEFFRTLTGFEAHRNEKPGQLKSCRPFRRSKFTMYRTRGGDRVWHLINDPSTQKNEVPS